MPSLTYSATLSYGDTSTDGAVQKREPFSFTLTYTEESVKTVQIPSGVTDQAVTLDSVGAPKFLLVQALETGVDIKLHDGAATDNAQSSLAEGEGWLLIANPNGQSVNEILVTTPASPSTGARVRVVALE